MNGMAAASFQELMDEEPGSYFVTDFMVRQFRTLILKSMGLDRFPHNLGDDYFGNYKRLVYLVQKPDPARQNKQAATSYLSLLLRFERQPRLTVGTIYR